MSASSSSGAVLEGVFAINKPPGISSAQVIRDVQHHFNPSKLFRPWLDRERAKMEAESHNQKQKRKWKNRKLTQVKMGHGGTLDPMATGVLILGLGSGTKQLNHFTTECTKSYEAVVLFGAATDTYDTEGKIVGRKAYQHITKDQVEEALGKFRGKGSQKPPIFSALRMQGKRLYEYARAGEELPEEIKQRDVEVHELKMLEWYDGGTHGWNWPAIEAEKEEKQFAGKILNLKTSPEPGYRPAEPAAEKVEDEAQATSKRKRDDTNGDEGSQDVKRQKAGDLASTGAATNTTESDAPPAKEVEATQQDDQEATPSASFEPKPESTRPPCPAPACRIRMTVTSGFYVRSLCHDLGASVGSLGCMASLVRTRQGDFELGTNVLWYDELKQGEDVWGPKVQRLIEEFGDSKAKEPAIEKDEKDGSGEGKDKAGASNEVDEQTA